MTIEKAIRLADILKPNKYPSELKLQYINEVEGIVQTEIMLLSPVDIVTYGEGDMDAELLVKPPHDKLYISYLTAMFDFAVGEYNKYASSIEKFNTELSEYTAWYARTYHPADGGMIARGYYLSAYAIAVLHGFTGTEAEWVASLKGDKGDKGDKGMSAYEIAVEEGFKGSVRSWLLSLKGHPGGDGMSAYEIAVMKGFEGTEVEWLASLKGKSAYEVAVAMGFEGTEWEWLASLKQLPQPLYFSIGNTKWKYDGSELTVIHINGISHALTDEDQADIAEKTAMLSTVGRYATVSADAWSDDTDLLSKAARAQRIAYKSSANGTTTIIDHNWGAPTDAILSEDWQTFEATFTYAPTDYTGSLYLLFYGGKNEVFCHPYDIADVKLWLASDAERTNLFPEDIAKLNWWWHYDTSSCPEVNRFSVAYDDDGHKYIHVWRQNAFVLSNGGTYNGNMAYLRAGTGVRLTAGETYTLSMRMRTTCAQHTAIAECEGIRDHSATVVSPVPTSTAAYLNNGVRAFGQRIGELMLKADTKPNDDITVGIQASRGQGTGVIINNVMPEVVGALDAALLPLIGEV